jgi:hypothetical protein
LSGAPSLKIAHIDIQAPAEGSVGFSGILATDEPLKKW